MPDANGRTVPISVPRVWCLRCGLFACECEPGTPRVRVKSRDLMAELKASLEHDACGTPRCCGAC